MSVTHVKAYCSSETTQCIVINLPCCTLLTACVIPMTFIIAIFKSLIKKIFKIFDCDENLCITSLYMRHYKTKVKLLFSY